MKNLVSWTNNKNITTVIFLILLGFILGLLFYMNKVRRLRKTLEQNNLKLSDLYEELAATNESTWNWDLRTNQFIISKKWNEIMGYNEKDFNNIRSWFNLIHPDDFEKVITAKNQHLAHQTERFECEIRVKVSNGEYKWIHIIGKTLFDSNNKPYRLTGSNSDISKIKEYQKKLQYQAYHDALTGLYNRSYLFENIQQHLSTVTYFSSMEAMLFIDMDNFKFINDTLGHSFGDQVIVEIAKRLQSLLDKNCILFRLGGDEFIFYIKNIDTREEIESYAKKITYAFDEPFDIEGNILNITLSIGISIFPEDGTTVDKLLRCADMAMYRVKERGRNGYYFFNNLLNEKLLDRVNTEKYLKKAIEKNELMLYYQPQVNVHTKEIEAFEALVRWQNPKLGMVSPLKFIKIAEETGFIIVLGEWILKSSCQFINSLNNRKSANYKVSVNISVIQLLQDNFIDMVTSVLSETGLPPALLELEITESIIMESPELIIEKFSFLRDMGISVALDDFGTGYSSLAYLRKIPISTLKIDKLFIDDISDVNCENTVTDCIIELGHKMGLTIVAEGVETENQLEYLAKNRCDKLQGYLFSKPLPPIELEKLL